MTNNSIFKREAIRIISNYLRLVANLLIGIYLVRVIVSHGTEFFGLYTLITIGIGFSVMLRELLSRGLVPELGEQLIDGIPREGSFSEVYSSSFFVSWSFALIGILLMALLGYWLLPSAQESHLAVAGQYFLGFRILSMCIIIGLAPLLNLLMITQRQASANLVRFLERLIELIAFITPTIIFPDIAPETLLVYFGGLSFIGRVLLYIVTGFFIIKIHKSFVPTFKNCAKATIIKIYKTMGWGAVYVLSMNAHVRLNVIFAKIFFGPLGVTIFGVATQLMGYTRQLIFGLIVGLDAVFASLTNTKSNARVLKEQVLTGSSAIQGILLFNVIGVFIFLHMDILQLWLGDVIENPTQNLKIIAELSVLMVIGISLRSLNLGWMSALTGSGQISKFAGWLLIPAILNPTLIYFLYLILGKSFTIIYFGWIFVGLQFLAHGIIVPYLTSRIMDISIKRLFSPFFTPLAFAICALVICVMCFYFFNFGKVFRGAFVLTMFSLSGLLSLFTLYWRFIRNGGNKNIGLRQ